MNNIGSYSKVSIIMTSYNRAAFIMESVKSVLQQTHQNWELIIVDDGSEDNTAALIAEVRDERVKFYPAGKIGLGIKLKNTGIERSDGELIAFIDSDDLWAPDKLEKQIAAFRNYPEAGFSITGGYNFKKPDEPLEYFYEQRAGMLFGNIFNLFFTSGASVLPQTLLMKRQCLPVIQQSVKTSPGSDVEFLLDLAIHLSAVILYEPLLYRRLHDAGFSINNWERGYEEGIAVTVKYRNNKKLLPAIASNALFRLYINYGESCYARKKRTKAMGKLIKAWSYKPFSIVPFKKTMKVILGL